MRNLLKFFAGACVIYVITACTSNHKSQPEDRFPVDYITGPDYNNYTYPPAYYRSFAFYSLNDLLDSAEISRQVSEFRKGGLGGFYLHSRSGLLTPYLGEAWWKIMDAAVDEANKQGIHAWFYDEDKWPSGYAGGIIPLENEAYRARLLAKLTADTPLPAGSEVLFESGHYKYISYTAQLGWSIFNGTSYVDLFNPEVVQRFIELSYEPYVERYRDRSPKGLFGIFSDEPHIHARYFDRSTPDLGTRSWSPAVRDKFLNLHGYDLADSLNQLFDETGSWRKVRFDYYTTVALQFEESFSKQISDYCRENGIIFAGHYLGEDNLQKVRDRIGNAMLHYRNMQLPGMDNLGLTVENRIITAKSLSSVANQFDKPLRLSEIFGISGQNMNFEDRKWLAGWHIALGVNHFVQHLSAYSLKGARKRDYPPTLSFHQPYWSYNHLLENYLGRLTYASTIGKYDPQILVINPLESEFIKGTADGEFTSGLLSLLESLQAAHFDYDLGDEQIMHDNATVNDSQLSVGKMTYEAVYLPDMIEIRQSTLDLLLEFAARGGTLLNAGRFPVFVDGIGSNPDLKKLNEFLVNIEPGEIADKLPHVIIPKMRIRGENNGMVWSQVRRSDEGTMVILANISRKEHIRISVGSELLSAPTLLWDPSNGLCYRLSGSENGEYTLDIPASSVLWLTSGSMNKTAEIDGNYCLPEQVENVIKLASEWQISRLNDNALTIDFAEYSSGTGSDFSSPEPVIGIFSRLSDKGYNGPLSLKYHINVEDIPEHASLVVEQPGMYGSIMVNGSELSGLWDSYYVDPSFRVTDVSRLLQKGINDILLQLNFISPVPDSRGQEERYGTEIESIYLIGDFAVKGTGRFDTDNTQRNRSGYLPERTMHGFSGFSVTAEKPGSSGDLALDGYPFYAGEFILSQVFRMDSIRNDRSYILDLSGGEAIAFIVSLNGHTVDTITWAPRLADLTPYLIPGNNKLSVTVVISLRNLLGPHHHPGADLIRVGPDSFTGAGGFPDPSGNRDWYDLRLDGRELRLWTDKYFIAPFGFLENLRILVEEKTTTVR